MRLRLRVYSIGPPRIITRRNIVGVVYGLLARHGYDALGYISALFGPPLIISTLEEMNLIQFRMQALLTEKPGLLPVPRPATEMMFLG